MCGELYPFGATGVATPPHTSLGHFTGHKHMTRKVRHSSLESRSARLKLKVRRKPYVGPSLARGISLLYRRNKTNGSWVIKASDGHGGYWTKAFAEADDFDTAD